MTEVEKAFEEWRDKRRPARSDRAWFTAGWEAMRERAARELEADATRETDGICCRANAKLAAERILAIR